MSTKKAIQKPAAKKAASSNGKQSRPVNSPRSIEQQSKIWFEGVIGQELAKDKLAFHLNNHLNNGAVFRPILFEGSQGDGKSFLTRRLARNFPDPSDPSRKHKKFVSQNGANIKNPTMFFEDICSTFADGTQYITIFIDEVHGLPKSVQNALLTILEADYTTYEFNDVTYTFDMSRVTWIFATTENDKVFRPLRDRCINVQLQPYNLDELAEIIELVVAGRVQFDEGMIEKLAYHVRRNGRQARDLAKDIVALGQSWFGKKDFEFIRKQLGLLPFGLMQDELRVLQMLDADGPLKLGALGARFGKPVAAVQKEIEPYPISLGFLETQGERRITAKGRQYLKEIGLKK
jgi:Holliday junction resolvasome RuvABC ATP-dependent DNA helicase subunit